jgi:PncC family amidohydrolase
MSKNNILLPSDVTTLALVRNIHQSCLRENLTLGLAESCTGGLLGAWITELSGASRFFQGGIVCYANEIKTNLLGVRQATLDRFGAVSEEVAREMASGARHSLRADIGLAITGIAGPEGGTPEKPVGTIWMAVEMDEYKETKQLLLQGDRTSIRQQAARNALQLLLESFSRTKPSYI